MVQPCIEYQMWVLPLEGMHVLWTGLSWQSAAQVAIRMCQFLSHCLGGAEVASFISFVRSNTPYLKLSAGALILWQVAHV